LSEACPAHVLENPPVEPAKPAARVQTSTDPGEKHDSVFIDCRFHRVNGAGRLSMPATEKMGFQPLQPAMNDRKI
jgi:hypothetical protein